MSSRPHIGVLPRPRDCVVPPGCDVVTYKVCETCGHLFVRKDHDKNCRRCHANPIPLGRTTIQILEDLYNERAIHLL